jgi:hypothetical protein
MKREVSIKHDKIGSEGALARYEREQREFENHWLWRELGTTPRDFFAAVDAYVAANGIDRKEWDAKVRAAKHDLESRVRAERKPPRPFSLGTLTGLRA